MLHDKRQFTEVGSVRILMRRYGHSQYRVLRCDCELQRRI